MQLRSLDTNRASDVEQFIEFPFGLYRECPQWVPAMVSGTRLVLDRRRHPFYRHSEGDFFVVEEGGKRLGQIAVLANHRYNDFHATKTAFFYYFDTVDDGEVARLLLDAAADWARARGMDTLLGPKGFMRTDSVGILIDGFEHRAAPGASYNYPYYRRLLEACGFEKEVDYFSGYLTGDYDLPQRFYEVAEKVKERSGFWIKSFKSKAELRAWVPHIQRVNNEAFVNVWGYCPMDDVEIQMASKQLMTIGDPHLIKLVMKGEEVAGFIFVFPDVSAALQKTRGRLFPFGWITLLRALKDTRRIMVNGVGLRPEYQGLGANAVLYTELMHTLRGCHVEACDVAYVAETNLKSMADMAALGVQWYKHYRVYRKAL